MIDFDEKAVVEKWNITNERQEEFWFMLFRQGDLRKIWKPQIEIIFIPKGTGKIYFANMKTVYTVQEEDIFVINSFEMNNLELDANAFALSFSVSLRFLFYEIFRDFIYRLYNAFEDWLCFQDAAGAGYGLSDCFRERISQCECNDSCI